MAPSFLFLIGTAGLGTGRLCCSSSSEEASVVGGGVFFDLRRKNDALGMGLVLGVVPYAVLFLLFLPDCLVSLTPPPKEVVLLFPPIFLLFGSTFCVCSVASTTSAFDSPFSCKHNSSAAFVVSPVLIHV